MGSSQNQKGKPVGMRTTLVFGLSIIIIAVILAFVVHDLGEAGILDDFSGSEATNQAK